MNKPISKSFDGNFGFSMSRRSTCGMTTWSLLPGGILVAGTEKLSYYNMSIGYNLFPGEIFIGGRRARPSQFYIVAGVGSTKFVDQTKPTFNVGFGYRVYLADWVALQLDLRDHIFSLDLLGKRESTQNLELTGGLTFYF